MFLCAGILGSHWHIVLFYEVITLEILAVISLGPGTQSFEMTGKVSQTLSVPDSCRVAEKETRCGRTGVIGSSYQRKMPNSVWSIGYLNVPDLYDLAEILL